MIQTPVRIERKPLSEWQCRDVDEVYEKVCKVGSGTYGEVNKARVRSDHAKFVALKKIKDEGESEGFPLTALREIALLQQCDHPNIVKLLDVVVSPIPEAENKKKKNTTYLVFEYMEHELLGFLESTPLTTAQVKCIMRQILEGLAYLHSKNIIHRDIKSTQSKIFSILGGNILINNQGEVKIADFGLSKKITPLYTGKQTQRVVTRWYRAPELLLGCKKYSNKIDMWAVGYNSIEIIKKIRCVFAELLLGKSNALFPAQKTPDQMTFICEKCGTPTDNDWPGHKNYPYFSTMIPKKKHARILLNYMRTQKSGVDPLALDLLDRLLVYNPDHRLTAEEALNHAYFVSTPLPCDLKGMPRLDKECHAFVLNAQRKVMNKPPPQVNVKNHPANNSQQQSNNTINNHSNNNLFQNPNNFRQQMQCPNPQIYPLPQQMYPIVNQNIPNVTQYYPMPEQYYPYQDPVFLQIFKQAPPMSYQAPFQTYQSSVIGNNFMDGYYHNSNYQYQPHGYNNYNYTPQMGPTQFQYNTEIRHNTSMMPIENKYDYSTQDQVNLDLFNNLAPTFQNKSLAEFDHMESKFYPHTNQFSSHFSSEDLSSMNTKRKSSHDLDGFFDLTKKKPSMVDLAPLI